MSGERGSIVCQGKELLGCGRGKEQCSLSGEKGIMVFQEKAVLQCVRGKGYLGLSRKGQCSLRGKVNWGLSGEDGVQSVRRKWYWSLSGERGNVVYTERLTSILNLLIRKLYLFLSQGKGIVWFIMGTVVYLLDQHAQIDDRGEQDQRKTMRFRDIKIRLAILS